MTEGERFETTVHDKRTGMPVQGCDGDAILALRRAEQRAERAEAERDEAIEQRDISTDRANAHMNNLLAADAQCDRYREALERLLTAMTEAGFPHEGCVSCSALRAAARAARQALGEPND